MWEPPVGDDDFKSVRDSHGYYVDKSRLIAEILRYRGSVSFLVTRPRRFGKSLNLSMVDAFFNMAYKGNNWFDGLEISKDAECMAEAGSRPVIRMNFKDLNVDDYGSFLFGVADEAARACRKHKYLLGSDVDGTLLEDYSRLLSKKADGEE